jgi:hypothetical protein
MASTRVDTGGGVLMSHGLTNRAMTRGELEVLMGWAADEGWNPGLHDAQVFWDTDREGFVAAELGGELVGGGAIVSYGAAFGFMGLFIIRPDLRRHGLGGQLWRARLERLKARLDPGAPIGMDGVFEMQDWYARGGFEFAHRTIRYRAIGVAATAIPGVVPLAEVPFEQVIAYDRSCFPAPRRRFLQAWVRQSGSVAVAIPGSGAVHGFGVARRCRDGIKVGPLFADDRDAAEALFTALAATAPGDPVFLDVPETHADAIALAADRDMVEVFGTADMYVGRAPQLRHDRIYGVTTFELG